MGEMPWLLEQLRAVNTVAMAFRPEDAEALLAEIDRTETLMPFLDPTAFREIGPQLQPLRGVLRAFLAYRRALEAASAPAGVRMAEYGGGDPT